MIKFILKKIYFVLRHYFWIIVNIYNKENYKVNNIKQKKEKTMPNRVFVSPGVFTSERDLSFITRQIGVTTLGLVGETTMGPAFQPIFVGNYGEFKSFFGGQNATKIKDNGAPKYELPYIANSYLSQSNQLFVTRVLGFSGFHAGKGWALTLDAALDSSTTGVTSTTNINQLISYTATSTNTNVTLVSSDALMQALINDGALTGSLAILSTLPTGATLAISLTFRKSGDVFSGLSANLYVTATGNDVTGNFITGTTSGTSINCSGSGYSDVENKVVALLRSRASVDTASQLPLFEVTGTTGVVFDPSLTGSISDVNGNFGLTGASRTQGNFNYQLSLDKTKQNYLPRALGRGAQDGSTTLYVEEFYRKMFESFVSDNKVRGINQATVNYGEKYDDYLTQYQPAVTPYVISELRGTKVLKLFRFWTISDGNTANEQFKISIRNIKLDTKEFDVVVRSYSDTDVQPVVLESFSKCNLNPTSNNFISRRIGTLDGEYPSKSSFVLIELDDTSNISDAFPSGFLGVPVRDYQANNNTNVVDPKLTYKTEYSTFENKRKVYLGLSDSVGIDSDFFDYKGKPSDGASDFWTGMTSGFHMDIDAFGATIDGVSGSQNYSFDVGNDTFRTEAGVVGGPYEKVYARKFTFAPYGGFDGWDIYRSRRSNLDSFLINGASGADGLLSGAFSNKTLTNGDIGINSDYYAYLEAIWTFRNPEATNINIFATPGIDNVDNSNLIEAAIEMIEQDRADSLYIMTTPDTDGGGDLRTAEDISDALDGLYDSNYSCTYWPWIQVNDTENNVYIYMPPTRDVVRNIALTDNISFPWFAVAGIQRGDVDAIQARKVLTLGERDTLYEARINPIATFTTDGVKIWGNKTLQVKGTALNRINVRRLLLQARKLISAVSIRLLFEQNDSAVRNQFLALVNPILDNIRSQRGLTDFRVVLSSDPEDLDRNQLTGQIFLKPTRALEFIQLEFVIMNTGASFDNV